MELKILSFSWEHFYSDKVKSVTLMTSAWEITILDNHSPILTSIKPSTMYLVYLDESKKEIRDDFAIWSGVVEVNNSRVKIMSDMLVDIDDIDVSQAERARQEALDIMEKYKNSKDKIDMDKFIEAEDQLLKSIAQLKLYSLKK